VAALFEGDFAPVFFLELSFIALLLLAKVGVPPGGKTPVFWESEFENE
jgi:hypothetical protein